MDQRRIKIKVPKLSEKATRKKNEIDKGKKMKKEEKGTRHFIRPKMIFPVKKMSSVISSVFSRKKPLAHENREQSDDSAEITEAELTLAVEPKQKPIHQKESFWQSARLRLKILFLGQRLKTRKRKRRLRRRRSLSEGMGEKELCKKRILMGERCKPMNKSGVLHYDGDGILLPEP
ncbi:hypothetical protein V5N11_021336 [Cardamine amara subsp. amara]|uniref:Uncharacterized protein n=1 Tax=Cardamine amara subsp. amara TaxID=228776 RepID=A0ABD1BGS0_CARAN